MHTQTAKAKYTSILHATKKQKPCKEEIKTLPEEYLSIIIKQPQARAPYDSIDQAAVSA